MKKTLILKITAITLLIVLVISIILNNSHEHVDEVESLLKNAKLIKIYNYQTKELVSSLDEKKTKDTIKKLNYSKWSESSSLNGDEKEYTLKLFEDEDTEESGIIVLYKSRDYALVNIDGKVNNKVYKINSDIKDIIE